MTNFYISFKRNSQYKQGCFIRKEKNKIRTLGGAEYVRGHGRARRRQVVRKVSKDMRGIFRLR